MTEEVQTRYHAEVKYKTNEHEVRVNIFRDTLDETFKDIALVESRLAGNLPAAAPAGPPAKPAAGNGKQKSFNNLPACKDCGTDENVQLITFTDRETGSQKRRYKCTACNKWLGKAF